MGNKHTYTINQSKTLCHQFYVNYQSYYMIFAKHDGNQKAHTQLTQLRLWLTFFTYCYAHIWRGFRRPETRKKTQYPPTPNPNPEPQPLVIWHHLLLSITQNISVRAHFFGGPKTLLRPPYVNNNNNNNQNICKVGKPYLISPTTRTVNTTRISVEWWANHVWYLQHDLL